MVEVVPKEFLSVALVGFCELIQHWGQTLHIPLELAIDTELLQEFQLLLKGLPVLKSTCHVNL
jgi:hypothetical protein